MTGLTITVSDENDEQLRRINICEDGSDSESSDLIVNRILAMYPESSKELETNFEIHLFPFGGEDRKTLTEEAISRAQGLVDGYLNIGIDYVAIGQLAIAGLRALQGKQGVMELAAKAIGFDSNADSRKAYDKPTAHFTEHWNPESHWENHSDHEYEDWVIEVRDNSSRLGYVEWVNHQIEAQLVDQEGITQR